MNTNEPDSITRWESYMAEIIHTLATEGFSKKKLPT